MRRMLEKLWYGNIDPIARSFKRDSEFGEAAKMLCKNEEKLIDLLADKEKEIFEKYQDASKDMTRISECETFISGFRLGARIMLEALTENDGCFTDI